MIINRFVENLPLNRYYLVYEIFIFYKKAAGMG